MNKKLTKCTGCNGQGYRVFGTAITDVPCPVCNGTGWMEIEETTDTKITSVNDILNPKDNKLDEDNVH